MRTVYALALGLAIGCAAEPRAFPPSEKPIRVIVTQDQERQMKLETLFTETFPLSPISSVRYDPDFMQYRLRQGTVPLDGIAAISSREADKRSTLYVSKRAFDPRFVATDDELRSEFDYWAAQATVNSTGGIPMRIGVEDHLALRDYLDKLNPKEQRALFTSADFCRLERAIQDSYCRNEQLTHLRNGRFKVRTTFYERADQDYTNNVAQLLLLVINPDPAISGYAKAMLETLNVGNTRSQ